MPTVDDKAEFDRLTALEPRAPKAAIDGYLKLSTRSSKWGANALFAAGRVAHDVHDPRARDLLTRYLTQFPNGVNAVDARYLLTRLKGD
jgi:hypothetical protein